MKISLLQDSYLLAQLNKEFVVNTNNKSFLYLLLSFLTLVAGYIYLRYAYKVTDSTPFTQEIVLIILGTVATIFITSLLLNKQTSVEIEKEQSIKFLELKTDTYQKLFDLLEKMTLVEKFTNKEVINLQFMTHRLAIISSADVLYEYQQFLDKIKNIAIDKSFANDKEILHEAIGKLSIKIREDIAGEKNDNFTAKKVEEIIKYNYNKSSHIA